MLRFVVIAFLRVVAVLPLALFPVVVHAVPQRALVNLSARVQAGPGDAAPIATFTIEGSAAKTILIRGIGPTLGLFGVPGVMADPTLTVYNGSGVAIVTNDNWGGTPQLSSAFASVGAFALSAGSRDAAAVLNLNPGTYSVRVSGVGDATGQVLVEIFDTDTNARLANIALRGQFGGGSNFVVGFVISGASSQPVLVRALGPALAATGVLGAIADPSLILFQGATPVASNDNWIGSGISDAAANAGLPSLVIGSRDSAVFQILPPGAFSVQVSNVAGSMGPSTVEIAVSDNDRAPTFAPALTAPLLNQTVAAGTAVVFGASYVAKPPAVTFQWRKNGANISGAIGQTLSMPPAVPQDSGDYSVVMTNSAGTTISAPATLSVIGGVAPSITRQPTAQTAALGGTATFTVVATGFPTPTYQWLFNGEPISGATSVFYTRTNVQLATLGTYSVRVSNSAGSVVSVGAVLLLPAPPVIVAQPTSLSINAGAAANFVVVAGSATPLTYQWRKDGVSIAGATNASFSIAAAQLPDAGSYTCVLSNSVGSVTTNTAFLSVASNVTNTYFGSFEGGRGSWALVVASNRVGTFVGFLNNPPAGIVATVAVATNGTFRTESRLIQSPGAAGSGTLFTLSGAIAGATVTGSLEGLNTALSGTLDSPFAGNSPLSGIYQATGDPSAGTVYFVVGGSGGNAMALTLNPTLIDGGLGPALGSIVSVTTPSNNRITGNIVPATGAITATIGTTSGLVSLAGSVTGGLGPPVITTPPVAQRVTAGTGATVTLTAGGKTPLSYRWRKDGTDIAGATGAAMVFASAQPTDAGIYTCVVANSEGVITSAPIILNVPGTARLVNLSILTDITTAGDSFTLGYVVDGNSATNAKPLIIRAAGPSLGAIGVLGTLADPKLELFAGAAKTEENDNWGGAVSLASAMANVGAFPYSDPSSRDAATLTNITTRQNSVVVSAVGAGTGTAIAEVYDATPSESLTATTPRLVNVSVIKQVGSGFTVGFVVAGTGIKTVLIRAVGPGLAGVGVPSGFLADPRLTLFTGAAQTDANDNWGGTPALAATMTQTGAFIIPAASRDAALLATLQPGQYSARVGGPPGASGLVLVEVYEVP